MAMAQINKQDKQPKKSVLEKFVDIAGVGLNVANTAQGIGKLAQAKQADSVLFPKVKLKRY